MHGGPKDGFHVAEVRIPAGRCRHFDPLVKCLRAVEEEDIATNRPFCQVNGIDHFLRCAVLLQRVLDRFGPCLIAQAHPLLPAYLERREKVLAQIESGLAKSEGSRAEEKRREIGAEREMIGLARRLWEQAEEEL